MKIDRLLGILNVLANTDRITIQELAERFEVSKRTIFRDLDTLNHSGVPIVTYSGIGGGVSIIDGYKLKSNILSKKDIKNVFTALNGLMSIDESTDLTNLIAKLIPEETSAVFSEGRTLKNIKIAFPDLSIILISHRLSTVKSADNLLVLKDSRIIEKGNVDQLYNKGSEFCKMFANQE